MKSRNKSFALAISGIIAVYLPTHAPTALAQTDEELAAEEIVVTATRREQSLQEVPLAVSALSAEDMIAKGLTSLADIQPGSVPGVNFSQFSGTPSQLQIAVRGVGIADGTQGTVEMPVPVYIDGVFLGRSQGLGLELIDPERIEVLRGPQGQLFGRNAEGGAVQFVTRKPSGEFGMRASASFGNYDDRRYRLSIDTPEFGGFSATISGVKTEHEAYTKQSSNPESNIVPPFDTYTPPAPNAEYGLLDGEGWRIALRWQSEDGDFTADYSYDDTDQTDSQPYLTWIPVDTGITPFSAQPASEEYPDETLYPLYNQPFDVYANGHALTLAWEAGDNITLKSITSRRETGRQGGSNLGPPLPAGGTPGLYAVAPETLDAEQSSQELQFIGLWERFDLTMGAIFYEEEVEDRRVSLLSGPVAPVVALMTTGFSLDPFMVGDNRQRAETESFGVYAQGSWRPAAMDDRLEIILGLRYSDDTKDALRYFSLTSGGPVNLSDTFDEQRTDPAFTIRYQWNDAVNTYLRYATGYRAGGANVRSSLFNVFQEETSTTWELGVKSLLADGAVRLNAALFQNTIEDEQLVVQEDPINNPSLTNTLNSPVDKDVTGAEIEFSWLVTERLNLGLNYSYLDADDTVDVDNPFSPGIVTRFWSIQTPESSGAVSADYERELPTGRFVMHLSHAWMSDYWATPGALPAAFLPSTYERPAQDSEQLSARLGWRDIPFGEGRLDLWLWGKNLTDDTGILYSFDGCASGGGLCAFRAAPKTYGFEVRYNY